jgi:hypothetical protein
MSIACSSGPEVVNVVRAPANGNQPSLTEKKNTATDPRKNGGMLEAARNPARSPWSAALPRRQPEWVAGHQAHQGGDRHGRSDQ